MTHIKNKCLFESYSPLISVLREWVLDNREVKSEENMPFTQVQVRKNDLRSRNESEIKMTGNRDREVKVK